MKNMDRVPSDEEILTAGRAWFANELAEARRRFHAPHPSASTRTSRPRWQTLAGVGAVGACAVLLAGIVWSHWSNIPAQGTSPAPTLASPAGTTQTSATPAPASNPATSPWPATIAGEPVLGVADVGDRVAQGPGSFLVGGFVGVNNAICVSTEWLAPVCHFFYLTPAANLEAPLLKLVSPPESGAPRRQQLSAYLGRPVVVRVHSHDPLASECLPNHWVFCDVAVVMDSLAWTEPEAASPS